MTEDALAVAPPAVPEVIRSVPEATKVADELATTALGAITDLMIATLKEEGVASRFEEVKKLCDVVQNLQKARARRAADFHEGVQNPPQNGGGGGINVQYAGGNFVGGNVINTGINNGGLVYNVVANGAVQQENMPQYVDDALGRRRALNQAVARPGRILFDDQGRLVDEAGIALTGTLDGNSLMRHMLMAFGPHAQTGAEANRAHVAADEAVELKALQGLLEKAEPAERATLNRRVKQLMSNMARRSNANPEPEAEVRVVPADDQRGHPPDAGGDGDDDPPRLRANEPRNARNAGAPGPGAVHQLGA